MNTIMAFVFLGYAGYLVYPALMGDPVTAKNFGIAAVATLIFFGTIIKEYKDKLLNMFSKVSFPNISRKKDNKTADRQALDHLLLRAKEEEREDLKQILLDLFNEFTEIHNEVKE